MTTNFNLYNKRLKNNFFFVILVFFVILSVCICFYYFHSDTNHQTETKVLYGSPQWEVSNKGKVIHVLDMKMIISGNIKLAYKMRH